MLSVIGDAFTVDHEQLMLLDPDLLLVWESGTPVHTIGELRKRGFEVAVIRTRGLSDIAAAMRQAARTTFNRISVDQHTSPSDTVAILIWQNHDRISPRFGRIPVRIRGPHRDP